MTQIVTFLDAHTRKRDEEFRKLTDVVAALKKSTHDEVAALRNSTHDEVAALQNSMHKEITVLQGDIDMPVLDVALIMASQLVSRVLGHSGPHHATYDCLIEINNQNNSWDRLLDERNLAAHPDLEDAHNYIEEKALKLIAILERSPPRPRSIASDVLKILKNRSIFLEATPCPDTRPSLRSSLRC